jgi:hypothetical protein
MDPAELAAIPVAKDDREQPWANLGVDYEDRVVSRLARETVVLRPGPGDEGLLERHAAAFLKGQGSAKFAAQVNLRPMSRPSFVGGNGDIRMRRSFADLVRREVTADGPLFRVIDIKATRSARAFHKTQVAFYALLLRTILSDLDTAGSVDPQGEIWRIPDDGNAEGDAWAIEDLRSRPTYDSSRTSAARYCRRSHVGSWNPGATRLSFTSTSNVNSALTSRIASRRWVPAAPLGSATSPPLPVSAMKRSEPCFPSGLDRSSNSQSLAQG